MRNKILRGQCIYCDNDLVIDKNKPDNHYVKTRRGNYIFFHESCYRVFKGGRIADLEMETRNNEEKN